MMVFTRGLLFALFLSAGARAQDAIHFTARFTDPNGYGDIGRAILVLGSERCQVEVYPATREFDVLDGPGGARTRMARVDFEDKISNDECSVSAEGNSIEGSGDRLTITVAFTLPKPLAGTRPFVATAISTAGGVLAPASTWIEPGAAASLQPQDSASCTFPFWDTYFYDGPYSMLEVWQGGPGCQATLTSSVDWLTVGTPGSVGNFDYIPLSVSQTAYSRYGSLTFTGNNSSQTFQVTQLGPGYYVPNVVSVTPSIGTGTSQVFTIQAFEEEYGYNGVQYLDLEFFGTDNSTCHLEVVPYWSSASLVQDNGQWSGYLSLPSLGTLQNSMCALNGALSSISGSGEIVTVQLALTFTQAFAGARYITGGAFGTGGSSYATYALWNVPVDPTRPALRITPTHTGSFTQLQSNATYTVTVSNLAGAASSSGTVTVADTLPQGLTLVSITGAGWSCAGTTCSRSDALAGGNSYPPIAVTVNVGATFGGGSNQVTLSGGGSATLTDYDYTNYIANPPVLSISIGDSGNFTQAQTNATYTLLVSNQAGADPTSGPVNVSESLPSGLTLVSIAGTGWTCSPNSYFYSSGCSRSDVLNGGSSYPPITVTVSVGLTATSPQVNTVSVSGVGSASASATDSTVIAAHGPAVTIQANVAGAPFSLEDGSVYQTPATIYWTIGTQHSVTWLTSVPSQPGASYSFESWSDGGSNPRTFTSTGPATYTANIAAFYLLTINIPFAAGGTVTASPAFSNGYYAAGTTVTLTAIPAPGVAAEFNGDFYGSSPLAITMNAPHTETASFVCNGVSGIPSGVIGPGPLNGFIYWPANAPCGVTGFTSSASWLTLGALTVFDGYDVIPYSVSENTGSASQTAYLTVSLGNQYLVTQYPASSYSTFSNVVSISPSTGTGYSQIFTVQIYDSAGYSQIAGQGVKFGVWCNLWVSDPNGTPTLSLLSDAGVAQQLTLPGTGSIQNSGCRLDAATSSFSGSGNLATVQLGLTFAPATAGTVVVYPQQYAVLGLWTVPANPSVPALSVTKSLASYGTLTPGQLNVPWTIMVSNAPGAATTSDTVTVTDTLPAGLTLVSMSGIGWSCTGNTCTRGDPLAGGSSYPSISVTTNVTANAASSQINQVAVSGGGSPPFGNYAAAGVVSPPSLQIQSSHTGSFVVGQTNATYTIQVSNAESSQATSGTVTVTENLTSGLSLVSMSGSGWTCSGNSCTTNQTVYGWGSFPYIYVTVSVAANATSPQVNSVTVTGGGSASASATDSTVINTNPPVLSVSLSHAGSFYPGDTNATYTVTVSNQAGAPATSGAVTVSELPPTGMAVNAITGNGWTCSVYYFLQCTRSDSLAGGSSYPPITVTVGINSSNSPLVNQVSVTGGGAANVSASDSTVILPPAVILASLTDSGFTQTGNGSYTVNIANQTGGAPLLGANFNDWLPAGLTLVSVSGTGWGCNIANEGSYLGCSRNDALASGSSYPPVTIAVSVSATAASPAANSFTVYGGGGQSVTVGDTTIVSPHPPAVTIQASVAGAPFTVDGSTYQAPATFYWPSGAQHTVSWLTAIPGQTNARFAFQSWADGGSNPRTFAGGMAGTYTANIAAQYQLSLSASPVTEGSVTASPTSPDGFYNAGQSVTITAIANAGFQFSGFSGTYATGSPWTFTMSSPQTIVADFICSYKFWGPWPPISSGPGPVDALLLWTSGPGCMLTAAATNPPVTVGASFPSNGFNAIPFTIAENTGAARDVEESVSGTDYGTENGGFQQDAAGSSTPGPVSVTPNQGSGIGQIFALQAYDATGYANIGELDLILTGMDGSECRAAMNSLSGTGSLYLVGDAGTFLGPLNLPGAGTLHNGRCILSAAGSSFSGSGQYMTANFNLTFTSAFLGSKYVTGTATDPTGTLGGTNVLGTWQVTVQPGVPTLVSPANLANNISLAPSLVWIADAAATSYDVYLGTSATPQYVATTTSTSYSPSSLNPGSTYYWQIAARNSAGSNLSAVSSFTTGQPCSANVTAASPYRFSASAGSATVTVAAVSGCTWGYNSPVPWVTFQPLGGLGSGAGSLAFTVAANSSPMGRSTTITVAGVNLSIAQSVNAACDVTSAGQIGAADIQMAIDEALGAASPANDLTGNGAVSVVDVQIVIDAALGMGCGARGTSLDAARFGTRAVR